MRLRRKRQWEILGEEYGYDVALSLIKFDAASFQERLEQLQRRVEQLERGQHGHCLGCGDTTGHYSQTHCGRADCEAA